MESQEVRHDWAHTTTNIYIIIHNLNFSLSVKFLESFYVTKDFQTHENPINEHIFVVNKFTLILFFPIFLNYEYNTV